MERRFISIMPGPNYQARSREPFRLIKDHVLLHLATALREIDATMTDRITGDLIESVVGLIPDEWLTDGGPFESASQNRLAYVEYLLLRSQAPREFLKEAIRLQSQL